MKIVEKKIMNDFLYHPFNTDSKLNSLYRNTIIDQVSVVLNLFLFFFDERISIPAISFIQNLKIRVGNSVV